MKNPNPPKYRPKPPPPPPQVCSGVFDLKKGEKIRLMAIPIPPIPPKRLSEIDYVWICDYCDTQNNIKTTRCSECGASQTLVSLKVKKYPSGSLVLND
jgi:hypothetical protein